MGVRDIYGQQGPRALYSSTNDYLGLPRNSSTGQTSSVGPALSKALSLASQEVSCQQLVFPGKHPSESEPDF